MIAEAGPASGGRCGLAAMARRLGSPLRDLEGCAERLGALGTPIAQVYVRAAETSLAHAISAIERAATAEGWSRHDGQPGIDPRLAEWLD